MLRTHPEVVNCLLQTYAANNFIAKTDAALRRYIPPSTVFPMKYAEALRNKSLKCSKVYDAYVLKGIFIDGPHESVHHGMPSYRSTHPGSTQFDLARYATSPVALQMETEDHFERRPYCRQNLKHRRGRRGNYLGKNNLSKREVIIQRLRQLRR